MQHYPYNGTWSREALIHPKDPICGADIWQLTANVTHATNIYCEDPTCSPGNRIAVVRSAFANASAPAELWVTDVDAARSVLVDTDMTWTGACAQAYGDFFFYPRAAGDHWALYRLRFSTLETKCIHHFEPGRSFVALGSASPDGRYLTSAICDEEHVHHVVVLDLENGAMAELAVGTDFCNPHPRFDRQQGDFVLVQHNRDNLRSIHHGELESTARNLGTTLVLSGRDGSSRESIPIARPAIEPGVSGHESWLKDQPAFVYSTSPLDPPYDDGERRGNLLLYRLGEPHPTVLADAPDLYFGHVSTSACGHYWCCDVWPWTHDGEDACIVAPKIAIGSVATRRWEVLCEVGGGMARFENGHAHPYLSADNRHVIYTSTRTGSPQIFRATLPEGFLANIS